MAKDLTGTNLGKYQIMERLGRGGMADVYRAYQPGMDRIVAIKIMHGHLASDESFITRFKREAHSVGNLRHPNIVQVIDFDVQDEEYYMVMEYIQGDTLKALLQGKGALPLNQALDIAIKLADALAYAHGEGMIHRDIKPANILFSKAQMPILTDFGIARIMDASGLTVSGAFVGTPSYISPEAGRGEQVDERADIYSLGIVLYEMLTGTVPYDADTPYAVILKHINDPLPTPRQFNATLPDAVERVILKALAKNKEDRFQNATEFKAALEKAKEAAVGEMPTHAGWDTAPVIAGPADKTLVDSSQQPARRGGIPPIAIVGIMLVVLVGAAVAIFSNRPGSGPVPPTNAFAVVATNTTVPPTTAPVAAASTNTQPAVVPPSAASTSTPEATKTISAGTGTYDLTVTASQSNNTATPAAVAEASSKYAKLTDQVKQMLVDYRAGDALPLVEDALKTDPQSYDLLVLRGRVYAESDESIRDKAVTDGEAAIKIDAKRPEAYIVLGEYYAIPKDSQSPDDQIAGYRKSVANYTQAIDMGSKDYYAYWGRALASGRLNGYVGADNGVPETQIFADFDKATDAFKTNDARLYINRGQFYYDHFNYPEAQKSYEKVLTIWPNAYDVHPYLAATYLVQDLNQKAFDLYTGGVAKNNDHKYLADAAYVAWAADKTDKANEWAKLALALDPETPAAHYDLALLAWDDKNYDEALKQLDIVLKESDTSRYTFPFFNRFFDRLAIADRGRILTDMGKLDQALDAYEEAIKQETYWPELYIERAKIFIKQDEKEDARADLRAALDYANSQNDNDARKEILALLGQLGSDDATATPSS